MRSAVTDADLFLSYNLPDKAIVPLLGALPQAPRDVRLNQRLAALHTRFQRFTEAAVCCRTLESVYHDAGYPDEAVRYGELAARYEQSRAAKPAIAVPAHLAGHARPPARHGPAAEPWIAPLPGRPHRRAYESRAAPPNSPSGNGVEATFRCTNAPADDRTADLSSEWEHSLSVDDEACGAVGEAGAAHDAGSATTRRSDDSNPEIAETVEEIRFYLEHFMTDQARAGIREA